MKILSILLALLLLPACSSKDENPLLGFWGNPVLLDRGTKTNHLIHYFGKTNYVFQGHVHYKATYEVSHTQVLVVCTRGEEQWTQAARILSPTTVELRDDGGQPFIAYRLVPESFYEDGKLTDDPLLLGLHEVVTNVVLKWGAQQ
jgi:hypothetical protein